MPNLKPLLAQTDKRYVTPERENEWEPLKQPQQFINGILTNQGNKTATATTYTNIVKGVPSPWARAKVTAYALRARDEHDDRTLMLCYKYMRDEWRGLMAAYALMPDRFVLSDPIALRPLDVRRAGGKFQINDPACGSIYGDMLFEERPLWFHEVNQANKDSVLDKTPYIQLLYYQDSLDKGSKRLVGATSPSTIFFTAANYDLSDCRNDIPWIDADGKFTDPAAPDVRNKINAEFLIKLHSFINDVNRNRDNYLDSLRRVSGAGDTEQGRLMDNLIEEIRDIFNNIIQDWDRAILNGERDLPQVPVIIKNDIKPQGPLAELFKTEYKYYIWSGVLYIKRPDGCADEPVDINDLFLKGDQLAGWDTSANAGYQNMANAPAYFLRADNLSNDGKKWFLALPLSEFALTNNSINDALDDIISDLPDRHEKIHLHADTKDGKVIVTLTARINGDGDTVDVFTKEYNIKPFDFNKKVFAWPNFRSEFWNKYFYYSEYPTNDPETRVIPTFDSKTLDFARLLAEQPDGVTLRNMFLVRYPVNKVDTQKHRYEIIRTDSPVKLLKLQVRKDGVDFSDIGYIKVKVKDAVGDSRAGESGTFMRRINRRPEATAVVGIDFGSTNTCAYYKPAAGSEALPIPFKNRRLALIGFDNPPREAAEPNELLFINNEEPINANGQIKSWLHEHDSQFVEGKDMRSVISGGIPVNETNISVHGINDTIITTSVGKLDYNMKWLGADKEKREAFMRMVWIQICADLYDQNNQNFSPKQVRWSFPSAMDGDRIAQLKQLYDSLRDDDVFPFTENEMDRAERYTEAEAVCRYATGKVNAADNQVVLGIDIGGSTSDILVVGRGTDNDGNIKNELYAQCSVRMAANIFFNAITNSKTFRQKLYEFHETHQTGVNVVHIDDIVSDDPERYRRAPYYLNNVFDQLKGRKEFKKMYSNLQNRIPQVFALPAYVTGMLCVYAGILLRQTIKEHNPFAHMAPDQRKTIAFNYFGKGGRLFEWLEDTFDEQSEAYFSRCLRLGLEDNDKEYRILFVNFMDRARYDNEANPDNKSEVAKGLVNMVDNAIMGIPKRSFDDDEADTNIGTCHEVLGEKGVRYRGEPLDELTLLNDKERRLFANVENFQFPSRMENFEAFLELYIKFITQCYDCGKFADQLRQGLSRIQLGAFFVNEAAVIGAGVGYRMPIFIAEGKNFLDKVLLDLVF